MEPDQHRAWMAICAERAELEFAAGRLVTGAEMAWGSAVHAVKYIAHQSPNLPTRSHDDMKATVRQLDRHYPTLRLSSDFGHAEALHRHFSAAICKPIRCGTRGVVPKALLPTCCPCPYRHSVGANDYSPLRLPSLRSGRAR